MQRKFFFLFALLIMMTMILASCGRFLPVTGSQSDQFVQQTAVMQTVSAVLTQQAFETLVAQATQNANQAISTPTPQIVVTQPINTAVPPTSVPATATSVPPTAAPTQKPVPCNWAQFIKDVSFPDGTEVAAGQKFTKTWQFKNIGTCTWTKDYDIVFVDGAAMSAPASVSLPKDVRPGETVDISVEMLAPSKEGSHKGFWMLRDASDRRFGLGDNADKSFWVSIKVNGYRSDDVPTAIYPYDFVAGICQSDWYSDAGKIARPCANVSQSEAQWAVVSMSPRLENGRTENERSLWLHLNAPSDWMQGFYPAQTIKKGDHFIAWIGCLERSEKCEATFSLDYKIGSESVQNLGKWNESKDGTITKIDIDLSQFEGKSVQFILGVSNKNSAGALDVFWFIPSIQNFTTN